jgi:hypothetical protein
MENPADGVGRAAEVLEHVTDAAAVLGARVAVETSDVVGPAYGPGRPAKAGFGGEVHEVLTSDQTGGGEVGMRCGGVVGGVVIGSSSPGRIAARGLPVWVVGVKSVREAGRGVKRGIGGWV